ncbi:fimbrillin family protein [Alistipes sp. OttesenSCG-928-B03]|nr:fimbrillin family protein [Alistipes sp. OttesenSCG-928-B03]
MNKIYAAIIIAAATVSAGCKSTCGGDAERREVTFSVSADTYSVAGGTRAVTGDDLKTRFEDGDMIGVFAVKHAVGEHPEIAATGNYMHNVAMTYDAANDEWTMAETCYYPIDGQMLDFYAYYPYTG